MTDIDKWNTDVLKSKGVSRKGTAPKIVRNQGDLQSAKLPDGTVIKRQEYIFVNNELVRTVDSELHFVYQTPDSQKYKGWSLWCTCGSIAGVVGYSAYSKLASPIGNGKIVACVRLLATKQNTGIARHADNSTE